LLEKYKLEFAEMESKIKMKNVTVVNLGIVEILVVMRILANLNLGLNVQMEMIHVANPVKYYLLEHYVMRVKMFVIPISYFLFNIFSLVMGLIEVVLQ
jgi:hypothetical protein